MPTTPILGITQVSPSQNNKEVTINDAIAALENATNATLSISYASVATYTLSGTQTTRNMIFKATGATAACELKLPITVNSNPTNRIFAVMNTSGYALTVKFATGAGTTVVVPNGEARLLAAVNGTDIIVAAQAPSVMSFVSLTDAPSSYTGEGGKFLAVNIAENAIEFIDAAVFPAFAGNAGKFLVVNGTETGVEWSAYVPVTTFDDLTDVPASYAGAGGKLVAVKTSVDGLEFIDPPPAEAVEFVSATRWRIRVIAPGAEPQVGFGEIEFRNASGIDQTGSGLGTATASTWVVSKEPEDAFDNDTSAGAGWMSDSSYVGDVWIEWEFPTDKVIRTVKLWPITDFPDYSPMQFIIERYNGATWEGAGEYIPATWVSGSPQTFNVLGIPLSSVADAPNDGIPYARRNNDWEDVREWIRDVIGVSLVAGANIGITVNDAGDTITVKNTLPYWVPFGFPTTPITNEVLLLHVVPEPIEFADEFASSFAYIGVNPAATFLLTIQKNEATVGTISISTGGVATFATTGGVVDFAAGDVLTILAPATVDTTIANSAFTLKSTRTS